MIDDLDKMVQDAVERGIVKVIPAGVTAIAAPKKDQTPVRFHPASCGKGDRVFRSRFLDEQDGDFS
ncbi:hypothetical protein FHS21_001299 [Phyllobacterium trifolii]|uniref:Uncharacterized protein n=1 Tax=Phyllobacterium trifolii TaxID=300193 RepID=A0A839U2M8_9HYPH|nr:hypothetical protein [Phyllobacterium trifolii]MBB3144898.1 hypothetical protein [Phyllobacterium trifolii]